MRENEENIDAKTTENIEKKAVVTENKNAEKKYNNYEKSNYTNIEFKPLQDNSEAKPKSKIKSAIGTIFAIIITMLVVAFGAFTVYNAVNTNIISGVSIKGVDVAHKSKSDARSEVENYLANALPEEIKIKHGDFESTISLSQMNVKFDVKTAVNSAYAIGRNGNIFQNDFRIISSYFNKVNIEPALTLDTEQLSTTLSDLSSQLPDAVVQSSYYIDGNNLIITAGKEGNVVDVEQTIQNIKNAISSFSFDTPVEIAVKTQQPDEIDVDKIHNEIYKEAKDAYYTTDPFTVYPSENGVDFKSSVEDVKASIAAEQKDEYTVPLKIIYPSVTTNMIGTEAFPDLLGEFSTRYSVSDRDRTTNLRLAANKVNGTVLMPGETFSYNTVVGERTIAAGYKEAPIYVSGQVVDGLGGGICQISSTIYNAVVYANLDIVERSNHQFVPSYVTASRDATVVYGSLDFKFKNNRNYPIKILVTVSNGVADCKIYGLKQDNDYDVQISSYETGRTATAIYSEAYKILKRNGQVVDKVLLSKDTYKRH